MCFIQVILHINASIIAHFNWWYLNRIEVLTIPRVTTLIKVMFYVILFLKYKIWIPNIRPPRALITMEDSWNFLIPWFRLTTVWFKCLTIVTALTSTNRVMRSVIFKKFLHFSMWISEQNCVLYYNPFYHIQTADRANSFHKWLEGLVSVVYQEIF
jgi:hypothetical protein